MTSVLDREAIVPQEIVKSIDSMANHEVLNFTVRVTRLGLAPSALISRKKADVTQTLIRNGGPFLCNQNRLRSLIAETIFDEPNGRPVRSVGTEKGARVGVTAGHIGWADIIFVMEKRHLHRLQEKFREELSGKHVVCLYIPDDYEYMDEALFVHLRGGVDPYVEFDARTR